MIAPVLSGEALLADIAAAELDSGALHLWWLGQSGFLVSHDGQRILLDPYLSDATDAVGEPPMARPERLTEIVIAPSLLPRIDLVAVSGARPDLLDPLTLGPIFDDDLPPTLMVPEAWRAMAAARAGLDEQAPVGIDAGQTLDAGGVRVTAVPGARVEIERDEDGRCRALGYVVAIGPWRLYHSGATTRYPGMEDALRRHAVDVALLCLGDRGREEGTLGGAEAARLADDIAAGLAVPCRYEMFSPEAKAIADFTTEAARLGQPSTRVRAGERLTLSG